MKHGNKRILNSIQGLWAGLRALLMATAILLGSTHGAGATTIDFETRPSLIAQPNNFFDAGPMQTYSEAGVYNISGGVVLGNPIFLPAFALFGSGPNLYGSADFADPSLLDTITFLLPESAGITSISGWLFNGQSIEETYAVSFYSGTFGNTLLSTQTFANVQSNVDSSAARMFGLQGSTSHITRMTVTTPNSAINGWDFFVDTLSFKADSVAVPEPSQIALTGIGGALLLLVRRKLLGRDKV